MVVRQLKIKRVSFKQRGVMIETGEWLDTEPRFELKDLRVGETYPLEISQKLDGKWIIHRIVTASKSTNQ